MFTRRSCKHDAYRPLSGVGFCKGVFLEAGVSGFFFGDASGDNAYFVSKRRRWAAEGIKFYLASRYPAFKGGD